MRTKFLRAAGYQKPRPTFVNFGSETGAAGGSVTIAVPSGVQNGDLLIACYALDTATAWQQLTGWTEVADYGSRPGTAVAYRIASSEPASYQFQSSGGGSAQNGFILAYRGAAYDTIGTFGTGTSTTVAASSITASSNNSILIGVYSQGGTGSATFTAPSGMTLVCSDTGTRPPLGVYSQNINSGATGTRTLTSSVSNNLAGILLSIKPA